MRRGAPRCAAERKGCYFWVGDWVGSGGLRRRGRRGRQHLADPRAVAHARGGERLQDVGHARGHGVAEHGPHVREQRRPRALVAALERDRERLGARGERGDGGNVGSGNRSPGIRLGASPDGRAARSILHARGRAAVGGRRSAVGGRRTADAASLWARSRRLGGRVCTDCTTSYSLVQFGLVLECARREKGAPQRNCVCATVRHGAPRCATLRHGAPRCAAVRFSLDETQRTWLQGRSRLYYIVSYSTVWIGFGLRS